MRKIEALAAVSFTSGRFKLTPEQYRRRQHVVKLLDAEQLIVEPKTEGQISFKRGEIIETDVVAQKGSAHLRFLDEETAAEAPKEPTSETVPSASSVGNTTGDDGEAEVATVDETQGDDPLADIPEAPPASDRPASKKGRTR